MQLSEFKRQLQDTEAKILKLVSEASDDILDDEIDLGTVERSLSRLFAVVDAQGRSRLTAGLLGGMLWYRAVVFNTGGRRY